MRITALLLPAVVVRDLDWQCVGDVFNLFRFLVCACLLCCWNYWFFCVCGGGILIVRSWILAFDLPRCFCSL